MQIYKCQKSCCTLKIQEYNSPNRPFRKNRKKAGVFIYDPKTDKVLLVQSRGRLWGPPKGTLEDGERSIDCALREVKEETGLTVSVEQFMHTTCIQNKAMYYYMEMDCCKVDLQKTDSNDANGITWIKISCLDDLVKEGLISLNHHAKIVFNRFKNKHFTYPAYSV